MSFSIPLHVLPPEADEPFNDSTAIEAKRNRNRYYFTSTYACPGPNALEPTFETKFARMEYVGVGKFAPYFTRYTGGEWSTFSTAFRWTSA